MPFRRTLSVDSNSQAEAVAKFKCMIVRLLCPDEGSLPRQIFQFFNIVEREGEGEGDKGRHNQAGWEEEKYGFP